MTPEQLATAHTAAIRRHWRTLADSSGLAGPALLDELAGVAEQHARDVGVIAVTPADDYKPEHAGASEDGPGAAQPASKTAARTRRTRTAR